jgi:hypothetical protein
MTPLEIVGVIALGGLAGRVLAWLLKSRDGAVISVEVANQQISESVRDAFQAGMLCAADIVTHSGNEELAGDIRRTVQYVRTANDN